MEATNIGYKKKLNGIEKFFILILIFRLLAIKVEKIGKTKNM